MYDELVKRLRHPWQYNGLIADLTNSAADAIEELSKRVASEIALEECWHRLENRPLLDIPKPPKEEA